MKHDSAPPTAAAQGCSAAGLYVGYRRLDPPEVPLTRVTRPRACVRRRACACWVACPCVRALSRAGGRADASVGARVSERATVCVRVGVRALPVPGFGAPRSDGHAVALRRREEGEERGERGVSVCVKESAYVCVCVPQCSGVIAMGCVGGVLLRDTAAALLCACRLINCEAHAALLLATGRWRAC